MLNLSVLLEDGARNRPERDAIVFGDMRLNYALVNMIANQVANLLVSRGIRPGDKVALACPNVPYFPFVYFGALKVSVKSSYFRVKERPSFVVYGTKGMFVKAAKDRQEEHLKLFYLPGRPGFGVDTPEHYGTVTYYGDDRSYHEEKVTSEVGDYGRIYDGVHESIVNGAPKVVQDAQTIELMGILEAGLRPMIEREAHR